MQTFNTCQAKVASFHVGKTHLALMAMGLNSTKTAFCRNASMQNMNRRSHRCLTGTSPTVVGIVAAVVSAVPS